MGCYCDVIGVRSSPVSNREYDYNEVILNQFIKYLLAGILHGSRHAPSAAKFADLIAYWEYKKTARPKVVMTWHPHPRRCRRLFLTPSPNG